MYYTMSAMRSLPFNLVEKSIRSKDFGILSTIAPDGYPHSTGILYAVSQENEVFNLYLLTIKSYKKARNIINNPLVSFVIPFPHHILRFVPASCVQFQGKAEIISFDDKTARMSFSKNKVLRMTLKQAESYGEESIFI